VRLTEGELRRLAADVDELHRSGMAEFAARQADTAAVPTALTRLEVAAVAVYEGAAASGLITTPAVLDAATLFRGHHGEHAAAFAAIAGGTARGIGPDEGLLASVTDQLAGARTEDDVLEIALGVENAASSTYLVALGVLEDGPSVAATASILPVESQHAVVLGLVLGLEVDDPRVAPPFETIEGAVGG
jgi:hypothetical protein